MSQLFSGKDNHFQKIMVALVGGDHYCQYPTSDIST